MMVSFAVIGAEIPVTPEMIEAARDTGLDCYNWEAETISGLYRTMAAHSPVELVPEGERIALARVDIAEGRVKELEARLADATNRNLILRVAYDHLAQRPAAFVDPELGAPKHNPFREFPHDPRRIGP